MKKVLTTDWHISRIFRVVTGSAAIIYAIVNQDNLMGIGGAMLLLMGIANIGCGGASGCPRPMKNDVKEKSEQIQFEEV